MFCADGQLGHAYGTFLLWNQRLADLFHRIRQPFLSAPAVDVEGEVRSGMTRQVLSDLEAAGTRLPCLPEARLWTLGRQTSTWGFHRAHLWRGHQLYYRIRTLDREKQTAVFDARIIEDERWGCFRRPLAGPRWPGPIFSAQSRSSRPSNRACKNNRSISRSAGIPSQEKMQWAFLFSPPVF